MHLRYKIHSSNYCPEMGKVDYPKSGIGILAGGTVGGA